MFNKKQRKIEIKMEKIYKLPNENFGSQFTGDIKVHAKLPTHVTWLGIGYILQFVWTDAKNKNISLIVL
jgi:hypothetical protein